MHVYKVREIKNGTGFNRDAQFVSLEDVKRELVPLLSYVHQLPMTVDVFPDQQRVIEQRGQEAWKVLKALGAV